MIRQFPGVRVVVVVAVLLLLLLALVLAWLRWASVGLSADGVRFLHVHALGVLQCACGVVFGWACFVASAWVCARPCAGPVRGRWGVGAHELDCVWSALACTRVQQISFSLDFRVLGPPPP